MESKRSSTALCPSLTQARRSKYEMDPVAVKHYFPSVAASASLAAALASSASS
jgi:hypothetical protein